MNTIFILIIINNIVAIHVVGAIILWITEKSIEMMKLKVIIKKRWVNLNDFLLAS